MFPCPFRQMTNYDFLLEMKLSGRTKALLSVGVSTSVFFWMDVYAFHLHHPLLSQWEVALYFNVSKKTIWKAYRFMDQQIE